ncbi:MAG TPA: hypothetical protein VGB13_01660 [Candidatus Krumholzibacteria bacterium]|jgi:hypothetical protein
MQLDRFSFLEPWTMMLPEGASAVLMAAGSGGKSTLLRRLHDHYRKSGHTVAWCALGAHPEPFGVATAGLDALDLARELLQSEGSVFVGGGRTAASDVERLRQILKPDILLVEGGQHADGRFEPNPREASWPEVVHRLFCVAPLHAVGRPWSSRHVVGAPDEAARIDGEAQRVRSADLLASLRGLAQGGFPAEALVVPFLSGFGGYRDVDGMFELVGELCALPGAKAVCLAELLGDERRDAADSKGLPEGSPALEFLRGERVYAVYPAELDE